MTWGAVPAPPRTILDMNNQTVFVGWLVLVCLVGVPAESRARSTGTITTTEVRLVGGERLAPLRIGLDPEEGCTLALDGEEVRTVALDRVVEIRFGGTREISTVHEKLSVVELHDGSRLLGYVVGGDDDFLEFLILGGPRFSLSIDAIGALFLGARARRLVAASFPSPAGNDLIFRRAEAGGDFTSGTFLSFGQDVFEFEYAMGEGRFPLDEIEAVLLAQQIELPAEQGVIIHADLWPEGSLRGRFVSFVDDSLALVPVFGEGQIEVPARLLRGLRFEGPEHRWLSDLQPAKVEQVPFLGEADRFLYPYRLDRTVTGRPLVVAGRPYAKGLGCHARTLLEFDLSEQGYRRFEVEVGLSDEVLELGHRGSVEFAVLLDGTEVFRSPARRGGDAPLPLGPFDLTGVKTLELLTDFGADEDVADRAVWGGALLQR